MKKVMMLGGNYFQMSAVKAAKELGYHVIDVDYLPGNPAHAFADEYYNISTIEKEKVLAKAQELGIDGIVSYASDVSAPTAAYVAEKMGLPTNPYESVYIMTHKDLFRDFLRKHDFPTPKGESFREYEQALAFFKDLRHTAFVKPVDSSGSKGCTKVSDEKDFKAAWEEAMKYSISKTVIVEEFIQKQGYQIDGDIFVIDGKIRFFGICDQHHDMTCAPYVPVGLSYPSIQDETYKKAGFDQLQRLLELLHMTMGAYNVEYIIGEDGKIYFLEIGPRCGGNLIPDTLYAATDVNIPAYIVKQAVGEDCSDMVQPEKSGFCSSYILHATKDGIFRGIEIDPEVEKRILRKAVFVNDGDEVKMFRNAGFGIGAMILSFDSVEQMCDIVDHMNDYIHVIVE